MLIENGNVLYHNRVVKKSIITENKTVKKIGRTEKSENEKEDERLDAKNLLILPGLIDTHVHFREPGDTYKEDFYTGSRAAIAGGVTTVIDMPNNRYPTVSLERLKEKQELSKKAICDVFLYMGATKNNFLDIEKARKTDDASFVALKIYLSKTTGDLMLTGQDAIIKYLQYFDKNKPIVVHAEGQKLIESLIPLVKITGKRKIHLAHAGNKNEVETVKTAGFTVEATPHHLFLSKKHEKKLGNAAAVKPLLASESERHSLWQVLDNIDCIATDHAPHTLEDKNDGAYGFPGLETSIALMLDAYNKNMISISDIAEKMSINPARIFNLNDRGFIEAGKKADLILVDVKKEWKVKGEDLETKCKWSPFDGWKLKGKVITVIRNGNITYDKGEFVK